MSGSTHDNETSCPLICCPYKLSVGCDSGGGEPQRTAQGLVATAGGLLGVFGVEIIPRAGVVANIDPSPRNQHRRRTGRYRPRSKYRAIASSDSLDIEAILVRNPQVIPVRFHQQRGEPSRSPARQRQRGWGSTIARAPPVRLPRLRAESCVLVTNAAICSLETGSSRAVCRRSSPVGQA